MQTYVLKRIVELEQEIESYKQGKIEAINSEAKKENLEPQNEQLQLSIESLDQAASIGVLDKSTQIDLDERVKTMDVQSQEKYWQRMFADLKQGRYELPAHDDVPFENYQLPDGEVNGEI